MGKNQEFNLRNNSGNLAGLRNLLEAEFSRWRTWDWYIMALIWIGIIGFSLLGILAAEDTTLSIGLGILGFLIGMFPMINIVIIMQDEIVSHRETGTIAWLLSKPVSRASFILAKLIGNAVGVLVSMVILPGIAIYIEFAILKGTFLSPLQYALGFGLVALNFLFYLTLTLMLGTIFEKRGGIIAIPLAFGLAYTIIMNLAAEIPIHPMSMFFPLEAEESLFSSVILGLPLDSIVPIMTTTILIIIFVLISLRQFSKEEF